jgi:hypothetical protein
VSPGPLGEVIPPGAKGQLDPEEVFVLPVRLGECLRGTTEPSEEQEPVRVVLPIRLVRTWVQIIGLPLGGRRGD